MTREQFAMLDRSVSMVLASNLNINKPAELATVYVVLPLVS